MEELPFSMAWYVLRACARAYNNFRSRCIQGSLDLAHFFCLPGSHNDINVLHRSPLFAKLAKGEAPQVNYSINGHDYTMVPILGHICEDHTTTSGQ